MTSTVGIVYQGRDISEELVLNTIKSSNSLCVKLRENRNNKITKITILIINDSGDEEE